DPRRDGFSFANSFRWTDEDLDHLARELRPLLLGLALGVPSAVGAVVRGKRGLLAGAGVGALSGVLHAPEAVAVGLAQRWSSFGLCGGMALAAVERWPHRGGGPATAALQPPFIRA